MPSHDVSVTGSFSVNTYKLTYIVDGTEYRSYDVTFGTSVTAEQAPEKEGHTFSGWEGLPETMPSHDVTVMAEYDINYYKLTVYLDGAVYFEEELIMGASIDIPEPQLPDNKIFNGWEEDVPETMPAHDIDIHGTTSIISAIENINTSGKVLLTVYSIDGVLLLKNVTIEEVAERLPRGLYVINGKKIMM